MIGIGGIFLFSQDPEALAEWYGRVFGLPLERISGEGRASTFCTELYYRDDYAPSIRRHTVFAIMPDASGEEKRGVGIMINYQVDDLEGFVQSLGKNGVKCDPIVKQRDAEGYGLFTRLVDLDGNGIELWEHLK